MPFPTESARDVLGLLRVMWSAEQDPHIRRKLAEAGKKVSQALELTETNSELAHSLVNDALVSIEQSMKYHAPLAPVFAAARSRAQRR